MGRPMVGPSPFKRKLAEHQPGGSIYKGSHNLNMKGSCQALWELDLLAARGKEDLGREQMGPCSIRTWKEQGHLMIKVKEELRDKQSTSLLAKIGCGDKHFHATQILELDTTEQLELNWTECWNDFINIWTLCHLLWLVPSELEQWLAWDWRLAQEAGREGGCEFPGRGKDNINASGQATFFF